MVRIEEVLEPGEVILKSQGNTQAGRGFSPYGSLYLTNKRIIFIPKILFSVAIGSYEALWKRGFVSIPLASIRNVKSSFGAVIIEADRKYTYSVGVFKTKEWVNAINGALIRVQSQGAREPPVTRVPLSSQSSVPQGWVRITPSREPVNSSEVRFCPNCGAKVNPTDNFCPKCGHKLR